jgi:signal transduction histidine kinase
MLESIHRLNSGADLIGRGNLDHSIAVDTGDELGGLAVSFNRMTMSLKDGNEDLRSFIYSLSHDLRSPLVNIKGFSGELAHVLKDLAAVLDRASERLTPEDRLRLEAMLQNDIPAALGFIGGAAERINELVNAVRKLSLVGQMDLRQETLDMDSIVRACLGRFSEEIARKNITVTVGGLPPVAADKAAMEEIVGNLLDNALKYLSPGRPGRVDITGTRNGKEILFQVRDNGRGIAKDDLAKIFGLFRRAGDQDIPGDGMGLTYVKALVRRHGGRIWCESEEGAGTTFSFAVPGGAAQGG